MLYYIVMADKYKPIEEVIQTLDSLVIDIKGIKTDISHIKEYIRKEVIKKQLEEEKIAKIEDEYVKPKSAWWW
jgi:hypothetical protein